MNEQSNYDIELISNRLEDTIRIGQVIGKNLTDHSVVALVGPLAAGKTALSKAIFEARGYFDQFSSPTYTIINEYDRNDRKSYHMDVYRIEDSSELDYIGYDDCLEDGELVLIEWADLIEDRLPEKTIRIDIFLTDQIDQRRVTICTDDMKLKKIIMEELHAYLGN